MTAATSGGAGDILYSIPIMRALQVTRIYIKENFYGPGEGSLFANLKPLLELNGFEVLPTPAQPETYDFDPGLQFDYNLDNFRLMPGRARVHIMKNMFRSFDLPVPKDFNHPWLTLDGVHSGLPPDSVVFNVTWRWRNKSKVDWRRVREKVAGNQYFLGLAEDHALFEKESGPIEFFPTRDFLEMARAIRDSRALYSNQGVGLVLAQSMAKDYYCEFKPGRSNTMLYTRQEHVLR